MDILILLLEAVEVPISMGIVVHIFGIQGMRTIVLIPCSNVFLLLFYIKQFL